MAKKLSPIGFLMDLLDVPVQQLAQDLFIDRTTISKWRSGARRLNENSPYFEKLVRIFMEKNEHTGKVVLQRLFSGVYPSSPQSTEEEVAALVAQYLQDDRSFELLGQYVEDRQKALYQTTVSVFRGVEGRKTALNMVLNLAEVYPHPCVIKLLELDSFEWMSRDMAYMKGFIHKIEVLKKKGHQFELSYATEKTSSGFRQFYRALSSLIYNKNFRVNLIDSDESGYIVPSMYAVEGKCVAVSVNYEDNPKSIHTIIHYDKFTLQKYTAVMDKMIAMHASPLNITDDAKEKEKIIQQMQYTREKRSPVYFFGKTLPLATMSEELVRQIVDQNYLSSADRSHCMLLYHTLRDALLHSPKESFGGLYVDMEAIEEDVQFDSLVQHELTVFSHKSVLLTRKQYIRHLQETADYLAEHENIRVQAVQGGEYDAKMACAWIKRNYWTIGLNGMATPEENSLVFLDDVALVNMSAELCEDKLRQYPVKFKNTEYIREVFLRLAQQEAKWPEVGR